MRIRRRLGVALACAAVASTVACTPTQEPGDDPDRGAATRAQDARPSFLILTADDATVADLTFMPHTRELLGRHGTTLTNMVAPTPICVPARASLLTGQYAHNHGARTIRGPYGGYAAFDDAATLPAWLDAAGYDTAFVGKYLNGYGADDGAEVPPGWDRWRGITGGVYNFAGHVISVDGTPQPTHGYSTDLIADLTDELLEDQIDTGRPWFTWVNYIAPHHGVPADDDLRSGRVKTPVPAPRHRSDFLDQVQPRSPDLFRGARPDPWYADEEWTPLQRAEAGIGWRRRVQSLQAVDEAVRRAVQLLRKHGELQRTVVMFLSDNGFLTGRHGHYGKLVPLNDVLRVPALVRGPGIPQGRRSDAALALPDIPVTVAAMAGVTPARTVDGIDLRPALTRPRRDRAIPIGGWLVSDGSRSYYDGVRVGDLTYSRAATDEAETLVDRTTDPYELTNIAARPESSTLLTRLRRLTAELRRCVGETCHRMLRRGIR